MYKIFPSYHYYEHPTDPNYLVYTIRKKEMAKFFADGLSERAIFFEQDEDVTQRKEILYHFAVKQSDREPSMELYLLTWAKFRKPFFYGTPLRFILLLLFGTLITLAIIGFIKK
mgnify:CR=1 FL=1